MKQSEKARNATMGIDEAINKMSLYWHDAQSQKDVDESQKIVQDLREIRKKITNLIYK